MRVMFVSFGLLTLVATSTVWLPASAHDLKQPPPVPKNASEPNIKADKVARDGFDLHYRVVGREGPLLVVLSGGPGLDVSYMSGSRTN